MLDKERTKMKIFRIPFESNVTMKENNVTTAIHGKVPMPIYSTDGASAFDLYTANLKLVRIKPHQTVKIPLGIKVAVDKDYKLAIYSRSGMASKGLVVANAPGIIDSDYRGEVMALVRNTTNRTIKVHPVSRICQGELVYSPCYIGEEVFSEEDLGTTKRGDGGFNSTGTK